MKKIFLFFFLICFSSSNAQNKSIDSLLNLLKSQNSKSVQSGLYSELAFRTMNTDPDEALNYSRKAALNAKLSHNSYLMAKAGLAESQILIQRADYDSAIKILSNALPLIKNSKPEELYKYCIALGVAYTAIGRNLAALDYYKQAMSVLDPKDIRTLAVIYGNIGNVYSGMGDYKEALEDQMKALKLNEQLNDKSKIASNLNGIAIVLVNQHNYRTAIGFLNKSIKLKLEQGDKNKLGNSFRSIGMAYFYLHLFDSSLYYFNESMNIAKALNDGFDQASSLINIGLVYDEIGNNSKALEMYFKALHYFENRKVDDQATICLNNIASIYVEEKKFKNAINYATQGLTAAQRSGSKESIKDAYNILNFGFAGIGDYKSANKNSNLFTLMQDSILNENITLQLTEMRVKYESEKKEQENQLLQKTTEIQFLQISQNKFIIWGLSGLAALIILIAFLLIRQTKFRNQQHEMQLEQKLLRSQMNPHFIFNSLQAIQNFILKQNNKDAVKYLSSFASITRSVLENSRLELIPIKKEVALLENYLQLQKMRFGTRFVYAIHVDEKMDTENTLIPPMLSQPFIENALEHGMRDIESGGKIDVYFTVKDNTLLFEVIDNGKGIQTGGSTNEHQSLALAITKERVELMNKRTNRKTVFSISDAFSGMERKGVKVQFSIPV